LEQAHYYKLLVTSGHYNTQLGLLATLQADRHLSPAQLPWLATLPATSSILVFELYHDVTSDTLAVRLVTLDGPKANWTAVPLPQCAVAGDAAERLAGMGACEFSAFQKTFGAAALLSVGYWCAACENTQMDACLAAQAQGGGKGAFSSGGGGGAGGSSNRVLQLGVAVAASVAATASAAVIVFALYQKRVRRQQWEGQQQQQQAGGALAGLEAGGRGMI